MEWQDLRILLAVARTGSVVAAARELAVAHTTVSRRLAALELHRPALFARPPGGAVRTVPPGQAPAWSNVVARKLATVGFALFGGERYFARRGERPGPIADLAGHEVITYSGNFPWQPGAAFIAAAGPRARCATSRFATCGPTPIASTR